MPMPASVQALQGQSVGDLKLLSVVRDVVGEYKSRCNLLAGVVGSLGGAIASPHRALRYLARVIAIMPHADMLQAFGFRFNVLTGCCYVLGCGQGGSPNLKFEQIRIPSPTLRLGQC